MIGIIGYGRFGRLMARYFSTEVRVEVYRRGHKAGDPGRRGIAFKSLEEVCRQRIVIPAVPISKIEQVLTEMGPLLSRNTLVVDVCSVKVYPCALMMRLLPEDVSILGTHPMFGPDSAAESLAGKKIVLCPQRIELRPLHRVRAFLAARGLTVIETTPEQHDRQIAISLALTHFIGRSLSRFGARPMNIDTEGYQRLLYTLETVENDTWQLFEDMHRYNPYAHEVRESFLSAAREIHEGLGVLIPGDDKV